MDWQNILDGLTLLGIPLVILIPLLVGLFRSWGMSERWTGPVAAALGVIGVLLIQLIDTFPVLEAWVRIPVFGLLIGLGSNGAFSQYRMWKEKLSGKPELTTEEIIERYNAMQLRTPGTREPGEGPEI